MRPAAYEAAGSAAMLRRRLHANCVFWLFVCSCLGLVGRSAGAAPQAELQTIDQLDQQLQRLEQQAQQLPQQFDPSDQRLMPVQVTQDQMPRPQLPETGVAASAHVQIQSWLPRVVQPQAVEAQATQDQVMFPKQAAAASMSAFPVLASTEATSCACARGQRSVQAFAQQVNISSPTRGDMIGTCRFSNVVVHKDHGESAGLSFADVSAIYGGDGGVLNDAQRGMVKLASVNATSFLCLDDRIREPSLVTPGGDLGEFVLALASYLQERDPSGRNKPTQEIVDAMFERYLETLPASRPMVHCTDDRAIAHLEATLPAENLDLRSPATHVKQAGLLARLGQVENQGDSHIRLMLKQPEWYQVGESLLPMVLSAFYRNLWKQHQGPTEAQKLRLVVLVGESNPQAFFEVSANEQCEKSGVAPLIVPNDGHRAILTSHMDAATIRRGELADFFTKIAAATPHKIEAGQLHQRLNRHGWLALETTGSHIAAGLPFYSLSYL